MTDEKRKGPQCTRTRINTEGKRRRCTNDGVACFVVGEFGREPKVLCLTCIQELRLVGWKVTYQLEGDKAAPVTGVANG